MVNFTKKFEPIREKRFVISLGILFTGQRDG